MTICGVVSNRDSLDGLISQRDLVGWGRCSGRGAPLAPAPDMDVRHGRRHGKIGGECAERTMMGCDGVGAAECVCRGKRRDVTVGIRPGVRFEVSLGCDESCQSAVRRP